LLYAVFTHDLEKLSPDKHFFKTLSAFSRGS